MSDYTPTTEELRTAAHNKAFFPLFRDAAEFDRWLAQYTAEVRAEWEAEQGETEWEYSWGGYRWVLDGWFDTEAEARDAAKRIPSMDAQRGKLVRRRKAGPWVPVEQEGESR